MPSSKLTLVAALCAALVSVAPAAHAEDPKADHSPCVSTRESRSGTAFGLTQAEVEKRWEVAGKGEPTVTMGWDVMAYKWCGHTFHKGSPAPFAFVGVIYSDRGKVRGVVWRNPDRDDWQEQPAPAEPTPTPEPPAPEPNPCIVKACPGPNL